MVESIVHLTHAINRLRLLQLLQLLQLLRLVPSAAGALEQRPNGHVETAMRRERDRKELTQFANRRKARTQNVYFAFPSGSRFVHNTYAYQVLGHTATLKILIASNFVHI